MMLIEEQKSKRLIIMSVSVDLSFTIMNVYQFTLLPIPVQRPVNFMLRNALRRIIDGDGAFVTRKLPFSRKQTAEEK